MTARAWSVRRGVAAGIGGVLLVAVAVIAVLALVPSGSARPGAWRDGERLIVRTPAGDVAAVAAVTATTQERGLMGRREVPPGTGMLFVLTERQRRTALWMKDTLVPLDAVWLRDGRVVGTTAMVPCPGDTPCPSYPPPQDVDAVLEIPAGSLPVRVGDTVRVTVSG